MRRRVCVMRDPTFCACARSVPTFAVYAVLTSGSYRASLKLNLAQRWIIFACAARQYTQRQTKDILGIGIRTHAGGGGGWRLPTVVGFGSSDSLPRMKHEVRLLLTSSVLETMLVNAAALAANKH